MDFIDIMLPCYGGLEYLSEAIASVSAQTNSHWRLTVVDDAYPGHDTEELVRGFNHPQIIYTKNEQNLGIMQNFKRSYGLVQSDWFLMLGADDRLKPNYIESALTAIESFPNAAFYQPAVSVIGDDGQPFTPLADKIKTYSRKKYLREAKSMSQNQPLSIHSGEKLLRSLYLAYWLYFPSITFNRGTIEQIGDFLSGGDDNLDNYSDDAAMIFELLRNGGEVIIDERMNFEYRRHKSSGSSREKMSGKRYEHEHELFLSESKKSQRLGWSKAARAARFMPTTRLNALAGKLGVQ